MLNIFDLLLLVEEPHPRLVGPSVESCLFEAAITLELSKIAFLSLPPLIATYQL